MSLKLPKVLLNRNIRTKKTLQEIHQLRMKPLLSGEDFHRLAELRAEINQLNPPQCFAWLDGKPVIDIIDELIKISPED